KRDDGASLKCPPPSEFKGYYQTWATRIDSEHGPVLSQILAQAERVGSGDWRAACCWLGRLELREFKYPGPGSSSAVDAKVRMRPVQLPLLLDALFGTCFGAGM
ncbi:uncharacterized protein BO80DRAFT_351846, partial [Aspergillus ibericus CBS 121593]